MSSRLIDKKLEYWENQLLDLGKRNKMISFRETKRATLRILEPSFESLFDRLVTKEEELTFQKAVDKDSDIRVYSVLELMDSLSAPVEVRLGDIKAAGTYAESQKTIKDMRNKARLSLDEQGTNILYMVFGFVEWKEKGSKGDTWIKSPLVLVPVSLLLESLNAPYVLKKYEDDLVVNPTLAYLFERDYGITLPDFDPDEDSIEHFMTAMEELVDLRGWRIVKETSLGLVSFLKISMYKDLLNNEADVKKNPIIRAFAGEKEALKTEQMASIDFNHDKEKSSDLYQVVDADSSQQDAILLSRKGFSFVMQGPPGTGKSQTITNIIAQGLADGKKILFVSEKMAALEVVYKRLEEVHLDDFCLALHSHKANKKDILEQLGQNLNLKHIKVKDEEIAKLTQLDVLREKLKQYVEDIHTQIMPLEMSLYEVYGAIAEFQELPDIRVKLNDIEDFSKDQVNRLCLSVESLEKTQVGLGPKWYKNPWQGIEIVRLGNVQKQELKDNINTMLWMIDKAPKYIILKNKGVLDICEFDNTSTYYDTFSLAEKCKQAPLKWIGKNLSEERGLLCNVKSIKTSIEQIQTKIKNCYIDTFLEIDNDVFFMAYENECNEMRRLIGEDYSDNTFFSNHAEIEKGLLEYLDVINYLKEIFDKLITAYNPNNTIGSMEQLKLLLNVCDVLFEKTKMQSEADRIEDAVLLEYKKTVFDIDVEAMLSRFTCEYSNFVRDIYNDYTDIFWEINNDELFKSYENKCDEMRCLIGEDYTEDFIFSDYLLISNGLQDYLDCVKYLKVTFDKLNDAYNPNNYIDSIEQLGILLDVCDVLFEKTSIQDKIDKIEKTVLLECEKAIFDIEAEEMLNRFKVEYLGLFKVFKKQYRQDIKQLRLGYKNVKKKILNDEASELLQKLRERKNLDMMKQEKLQKAASLLGIIRLDDIDSVLTAQEVNESRIRISKLGEFVSKYVDIPQNGIKSAILNIENSQSELKELMTKIEVINSYVKSQKNYSEIKNDFVQLQKSGYKKDIAVLCAVYQEKDKNICYDEALVLLQKLQKRANLFVKKREILHKIASMLNLECFEDIDSVLTEQKVEETRILIEKANEMFNKYTNIPQNKIDKMLSEILTAQDKMKSLVSEIARIVSYTKMQKNYKEIKSDAKLVMEYKSYSSKYEQLVAQAKEVFDSFDINTYTDWDSILIMIGNFEELSLFIEKVGISSEWLNFILDINKANEIVEVKKYIGSIIEKKSLFENFISMFDSSTMISLKSFKKLKNRIEKCVEQFDTIDLWIDYRDCKSTCEKAGLADFILQSEDVIYPEGTLDKVFLKAFYYTWIEKKMSQVETISGFNARTHDDNVEKFKELDSHQLPVAQMRIREKLNAGMPNKSSFNRTGDEMSVLLHELGKKRKIMPLRKLFRSMPNLLLKLKPCLMMSPLSVSYFLEADTYKFDMVIFDEASQIFPQDAIGAIFRGLQVIIAGDSKQLPPTNFFAASTNNDTEFDNDEDDVEEIISDSILEEATNTIPNRSLLWHYRSRYEDLISFSNREIYGDNLVTFPSSKVNEVDSGVEYIYVKNGVYENRCNKEEAACCVRLIEEHIKKYPNRSLGVIAFSESQQSTVEDAVQEFRKMYRQYEKFFDENKEDAFFIKNLENVQGDERDTIIFSICYGKNSQGRMFMRFGPLGHQGGERRLNVAITRAKYNVKLVGSIQPEDIDLDKTKSEGVKMLKSYIEFASRTNRQMGRSRRKNRLYETDVFSEQVANYIESKGYIVKRNVGNSDYTVDIVVEHPDITGAYIVGIECDGESYQMARTVRDRDHLRTAVMERMGWRMYRVWSTEWIQNENEAKLKLVEFIADSLKNYTKYETIMPKQEKIEIATEEVSQVSPNNTNMNSNNPYNLERYQEGHWRDVNRFRAYDNESQIADRVHEVVRVEQPIHLELLYKRMAGCFGNEKVTAPIRNSVDIVIKQKMKNEIKIDRDSFVTLSGFGSVKVRRSLPGSPDRNVEHIPLNEIEEAMKLVLMGAFGVEISALILETARIFGFGSTGAKIKQRMTGALTSLENQGKVRISDSRVQLLEVK